MHHLNGSRNGRGVGQHDPAESDRLRPAGQHGELSDVLKDLHLKEEERPQSEKEQRAQERAVALSLRSRRHRGLSEQTKLCHYQDQQDDVWRGSRLPAQAIGAKDAV